MSPKLLLLSLSLWTLSAPAWAGEVLTLSYDGALQQALDRNPALLSEAENLRKADGALMAARGVFDPSLSANAGLSSSIGESFTQLGDTLIQSDSLSWSTSVSETMPTGTSASLAWNSGRDDFRYELRDSGFVYETQDPQVSSQLTASISQALLRGHKMSYNLAGVRSARVARSAAEAALLEERQQALANTANAYWLLWYQQRLVDLGEESVEVAQEEKRIVEAQVAQGRMAPVEVARVDATLVQARSTLIEARNAAADAEDALLYLIGESPGRTIALVTDPADPEVLDIDELTAVNSALSHNPTLAAARISEENAAQDLSDARHARLPELSASASYGLKGYDTSASASASELFSGDLRDWYVGADLSVPLGNRAARGDYLSNQASLAQARIEREALERSIDQQVRAQVRKLESAKVQVELADARRRLAQETLAADKALQQAGRTIQRDVIQSMNDANDAEVAFQYAKAQYQLAIVELKRLQGAL